MKSDPLITYRRRPASIAKESLEDFADLLRIRIAKGSGFHCRITTDGELQSLNAQFRKKDYPTDVLSFPSGDRAYLGDIAISIDRARAQAKSFGHSLEEEVRILLLHGLLHLIGMDHEKDGGDMAHAEARWRKKLQLPNGLIERVLA